MTAAAPDLSTEQTPEPAGDAVSLASALAGDHPAIRRVLASTLEVWPDHLKFLRKSFAPGMAQFAPSREVAAVLLERVVDARGPDLATWIADYRFMCEEIVLPEEFYFRRHDRYRLSSFAEADAEVYANAALMSRYMNGLLVSDVLWANHAGALDHFANRYLAGLTPGGVHLEVGPGHGLLLHLALRSGRFGAVNAWDVSETSIAHAREVLSLYGEEEQVSLRQQNLYDEAGIEANAGRFSTIVLSEVLEHLEEPASALAMLRRLLAPGGTIWINVPANCPAPDHLFLVRDMNQIGAMLANAGLEITDQAAFPVTGATLEKAVRNDLTVSYVVVARASA